MKIILFCITLLCTGSASAQQDPSNDLLGHYNGASGGIVGGPPVSIGRPDPFFDALLLAQVSRPRGLGTTITQDTYTTPSLLSIIAGGNGTVTSTVTKIYPAGQYPVYPNPFFALPPSR